MPLEFEYYGMWVWTKSRTKVESILSFFISHHHTTASSFPELRHCCILYFQLQQQKTIFCSWTFPCFCLSPFTFSLLFSFRVLFAIKLNERKIGVALWAHGQRGRTTGLERASTTVCVEFKNALPKLTLQQITNFAFMISSVVKKLFY